MSCFEAVSAAAFVRFLTKQHHWRYSWLEFPLFLLSLSYFSDLKGEEVDFERIIVKRDSREFQTVYKRFHSTIPESKASIKTVCEIKNGFLLERYNRYMHVWTTMVYAFFCTQVCEEMSAVRVCKWSKGRKWSPKICGPIWGSFTSNLQISLQSGIICRPVQCVKIVFMNLDSPGNRRAYSENPCVRT